MMTYYHGDILLDLWSGLPLFLFGLVATENSYFLLQGSGEPVFVSDTELRNYTFAKYFNVSKFRIRLMLFKLGGTYLCLMQ